MAICIWQPSTLINISNHAVGGFLILYQGLGIFSRNCYASNYSPVFEDFSKLKTFKTIFIIEALIISFFVLGRFSTSNTVKSFQRYK